MTSRSETPEAFTVAQAEYPGKPLERCSCGCLKPRGERCPHAERLFEPAPEPMPGQTALDIPEGWDG